MSAADQTTLIGEQSNRYVDLETDARIIRPLLAIPTALIDECRLTFDADGLHARATDPANVGLFDLSVPAAAFDEFDLTGDELEMGLDIDRLASMVADARMHAHRPDPVTLRIGERHVQSTIEREYGETVVRRRDEMLTIDPDSIRSSPEIPDMELDFEATVPRDALADTIEHLRSVGDHAAVRERDGDLVVAATGDTSGGGDPVEATAAVFDGVASAAGDGDSSAGVESLFSLDYWIDISRALRAAKVDSTRVVWGEQMPVMIHFERTADGETLYEGQFMIAPRIQADGGP